MSVWAIGDLQGCYAPTQRLLERIRFDPAVDQLWFCGDLVNRGGESLETLRLVHSLRANCVTVLGNHDLSLLAIGERRPEEQRKVNPDLQRVLFAEDSQALLDWLRTQPLVHVDRALGWMMVHAGLAPKWTTTLAEKHAHEVEQRLRGDGFRKLLKNMNGDRPVWSPRLAGSDRDLHAPDLDRYRGRWRGCILPAFRSRAVGRVGARNACRGCETCVSFRICRLWVDRLPADVMRPR
jgi:bis(5'-nucleosyl)-tetraphosphatase (symmetrical)